MIVITVARKPLAGSVAKNVLAYGTGGINIDETRISVGSHRPLIIKKSAPGNTPGTKCFGQGLSPGSWEDPIGTKQGRWPANLILQHLPGCQQAGTKKIAASPPIPAGWDRMNAMLHRQGYRPGDYRQGLPESPADNRNPDGTETVATWDCTEGCPVAEMEIQGGISRSGTNCTKRASSATQSGNTGAAYGKENRPVGTPMVCYGDVGLVSRFFKQVQGGQNMMTKVPQELIDYLILQYSPPAEVAPPVEYWEGLDRDTSAIPDGTLTGLILAAPGKGRPTQVEAAEIMRILRPGAHFLIIPAEDQPTGHTGTCNAEDAGFEIRDSILVPNKAGDGDYLHYVPKAARSEREAGCYNLPARTGFESVEREEGTAALDCPRTGAGRLAVEIHNFHPCVKPKDLMIRLLSSVPRDQGPVIDPFLGSGSTGVAVLKTGHDFIGIDREEDYLRISEARVKHWKDQTLKGDKWDGCQIISEAKQVEAVVESRKPKSAIEDLFGG